MAKEVDFAKAAREILAAIGGKENVANVTHCMTRLRFNLKDESIPQKEEIQAIQGVIGVVQAGGQYQVIIGQTVDQVYQELCEAGEFKAAGLKSVQRREKKPRPKNLKEWGSAILDGLAGCLTPLIPLLVAASMFKLFVAVFGPAMLGWMEEGSDLYKLFAFVGDAGFYFLPVAVGYTSAKKFGVTPVIGIFLGGVFLHPVLLGMAAQKTAFTVYGIPAIPQNYASTILPSILSVWVLSYVEAFFKQHLPDTLKTIFAPTLSMLVMLPISLCVLGPAGSFLGTYICGGLLSFSKLGGVGSILVMAVIGALYEFLVMSGMHLVLIATLILVFSSTGQEALVTPGACAASLAVSGMALGTALRLRNKEERSLSIGYLIAGFIGGVTEPALYGVGMRYKRPLLGMMLGGAAGSAYAGIVGLTAYNMVPVASVLCLTAFAGGSTANLINGVVLGVISFSIAAAGSYFAGVEGKNAVAGRDGENTQLAENNH